MVKERLGKAYDKICMLMVVYISLGAPRMINYTATHSVVCDRNYTTTQGVVRDKIHDHTKEEPPKCDPDGPSWNR